MVVKDVKKYASTVTDQYNSNKTGYNKWTKPENAIGYVTSTNATNTFTKEKYATHYKTVYKKDKNGKEVATKVEDKWSYKYTKPSVLSAHDFHLDIPSDAVVSNLKFEVRIKTGNPHCLPIAPKVRVNLYGGAYDKNKDDDSPNQTGWKNGAYYIVKTEKLSNNYKTLTYEIPSNVLNQAEVYYDSYNRPVMGIDLIFNRAFEDVKPDKKTTGTVYVEWVKCIATYMQPDCVLSMTTPFHNSDIAVSGNQPQMKVVTGTEKNPHVALAGEKFPVVVDIKNGSRVPKGDVFIAMDYPDGATISDLTVSEGNYSEASRMWATTLGGATSSGSAVNRLQFNISSKREGLQCIKASIWGDTNEDHYFYFYINPYDVYGDGDSDIQMTVPNELHAKHLCCASIVVKGYSSDTNVQIQIDRPLAMLFKDLTLSSESYNVASISNASETGCTATLSSSGDYLLSLRYCFYPSGSVTALPFTITNLDDPNVHKTFTFPVNSAYTYVISNSGNDIEKCGLNPDVAKINNHRVITDIYTNSSIVSLVSDNVDSDMIMSECSLSMDIWDDLDYIGCIPLEQTHFDPKSTYKDTLLNQTYKNKKYMGKKLATDEDITLNVRLHPHQVTTLQGLIAMDKPIPINANHKCFEGDALNHRGWAEIYGVKVEQTGNNPHWYKCDIDVKYLTHNLNTRFKIEKGEKDEEQVEIPSLMTETFSSGDNLSDVSDPYFEVDTDGTFYYNAEMVTLEEEFQDDEDNKIKYVSSGTYTFKLNGVTYTESDIDDVVDILQARGYDILEPVLNEYLKYQVTESVPIYQRNNFNIDNGQSLKITSKNPLTHSSVVDFTWTSAIIDELRENNISRIVRLIDNDNGETVFEYEYDDLQFSNDEVTANVIYRILEGGVLRDYSENITFRYNPSDITTESETIYEDDTYEVPTGEAHFGSTLSLSINNGKISIIDAGFNGREVAVMNKAIPNGSFKYQVEWINQNMDDETSDIDCIFDFRVQDTILTSTYADKWGKLIVSPFPVADKDILFTRQAEEGTIYYYADDGKEFSYLVEPYYQYLNGCDLQSQDGISTTNLLDYGYEIVYILNGLVRLGFNRLTGELYLGKWDTSSESYITVSRIHLSKFNDVNLNSIDDDKIEVQASDCIFTIWRGHPYIKVKHELEDLILDTQYNTVWAEQVGKDSAVELPAYWDLMNNKNLLPASVGGNTTLKTSDVEITSQYVSDRTSTSIAFTTATTTDEDGDSVSYTVGTDTIKSLTGHDITFTVSGSVSSYTDVVDLDDSTCSFGEIVWTESCDTNTPTAIPSMMFSKDIIQTGDGIDVYANVTNPCNIGIDGVRVDFYEVFTPTISLSSDPPIIQSGEVTQIKATVKDEDGSLVKGQRVDFYIDE